jgi:hypothetical protein
MRSQIEGDVNSSDRKRDHRLSSSKLHETTSSVDGERPYAAPLKWTHDVSIVDDGALSESHLESFDRKNLMLSVEQIPFDSLHVYQRSSNKDLSKLETEESQATFQERIKVEPQEHLKHVVTQVVD